MAGLSDFKRYQIVDACMVGTSVTKITELFGVARITVSKVMTAFEKDGKISSQKKNSGRTRKLSDRNHRTLTWFVRKDHKKNTTELKNHLKNPVSSKTVRRELHIGRFHKRATY